MTGRSAPNSIGSSSADSSEPPPVTVNLRIRSLIFDVIIVVAIEILASTIWGSRGGDGRWHTNGLAAVALILFFPVYWLAPDMAFGRSPAEMILGLQPHRVGGGEVRAWQYLIRSVVKIFEFSVLFLPSIVVLANSRRRQTIGEMLGGFFLTEERSYESWRMGGSGESFKDWLGSMKNVPQRSETSERDKQ